MDARKHEPVIVHNADDDWHVMIPAEVCAACSDLVKGIWVPASFCPEAAKIMEMDGWSAVRR